MQAQLSWMSLVQGFSWGCNQAATWDCGLIWRLTGVGWRDLLPSSPMQGLAGLIPLPYGPLQRVPHGMVTGFPQHGWSKGGWETTVMTEAAIFCFCFLNNLISEVTSHCFCHIQFIRIKLQSEVDAQAEGTAHAGISGGHLRSFHHGYSLTWNLKFESNLLTENTGK